MASRKIKAIRLLPHAILPQYAHPGDSGLDLYAAEGLTLRVGQRGIVRTGIALEIPLGFEGQVRSRSGLAKEKGVVVLNSPGTIDSGYRGEVLVLLANFGGSTCQINPGMRIAQLVFGAVIRVEWREARDIRPSKRGARGFGSTGGYSAQVKKQGSKR